MTSTVSAPKPAPSWIRLIPGVLVSFLAVGISLLVNSFVPILSAMLVAILLGVIARNALPLPASLEPGLAFAAKRLLRVGVVLLGLQLIVSDIVALGAGMILVVVAVVAAGMGSTLLIGRAMRLSLTQTLLVAGGFSICGAAAVAAVDGVIETKEREEVVTAVGLVVIFGTLMIPIVPILGALIGFAPLTTGLWAGASTHEVAQVVAIGGALGEEALAGAVVVKLARVLMLAPVMAGISLWRRHAIRAGRELPGMGAEGGTLPPIMPAFVGGFILMVLIRWLGVVPASALAPLKILQTALLASAMFALGTGVRLRDFAKVGPRPFVLAAASTLVVGLTALGGVALAH
ncbi:YeiH family protein [Schaalia hyovaginalis]|uniref:YeiH family protein n=1 Tax=Schaalia hyovaginalis TaxID=29316 RepID=UPI0026F0BCC8|nr:putative sulfate exporter family transporter [Schaalia hyovaginalis]MCI6556446.1 putative sulfate exporter family transporter [Schaalia hyovaginalis]MDD7554467.1 putative sulfate exporter family transporter [Schaalia hyovaginalis]MDY3094441.1 putative sulfate exporter family transporter [Schaalia hyovaginalis]